MKENMVVKNHLISLVQTMSASIYSVYNEAQVSELRPNADEDFDNYYRTRTLHRVTVQGNVAQVQCCGN